MVSARTAQTNRMIYAAGGGVALLLAVLFAIGWATREDPSDKPPIEILGGGFILNYRIADTYYGFTAHVTRPLASGSIIEASFEDPAGGPPFVVRERVSPMTDRYAMRSPSLFELEAGRPYAVAIRVLDREGTEEIWSETVTYASRVGGDAVPRRALTVGPGYHRNPAQPGG